MVDGTFDQASSGEGILYESRSLRLFELPHRRDRLSHPIVVPHRTLLQRTLLTIQAVGPTRPKGVCPLVVMYESGSMAWSTTSNKESRHDRAATTPRAIRSKVHWAALALALSIVGLIGLPAQLASAAAARCAPR